MFNCGWCKVECLLYVRYTHVASISGLQIFLVPYTYCNESTININLDLFSFNFYTMTIIIQIRTAYVPPKHEVCCFFKGLIAQLFFQFQKGPRSGSLIYYAKGLDF